MRLLARFFPVLLVVSAFLAAPGCRRHAAPANNPDQPLEERRAVPVIRRAMTGEGFQPAEGRIVKVTSTAGIKMDVGATGKLFGVAYTTRAERDALGTALAPREYEGQLQLVTGSGTDEGARVLILHRSDYMLDDHMGASYEESTITAERRLNRDVRDFCVEAKEAGWP